MPDQDVQNKVTALNAGWYNVVRQALSLDPATFQLAQGSLGLQSSDSSGLFLMSDGVPPSASVAYYDPAGMKRWSDGYIQLLGALRAENSTSLASLLGDQYANWIQYRNSYRWPDPPAQQPTQEDLFRAWANRNLDPTMASSAITAFGQAATSGLYRALDAVRDPSVKQQFVDGAGKPYSLFKYSATVGGAASQLASGKSAVIEFDSSTMDTTLRHTTAHGSASGFYDIFSGSIGGSFDQLNKTAAESRMTIQGVIGKYATLATSPLGWVNSAEISRAYTGKGDASIWEPTATAGNWDSFFGQPDGMLARRISQLVLVSDYEVTVTTHASYSSEDATKITAEAKVGVWPFFSASASASHETKVTHNSNGSLSVTNTLPKGVTEIWGVTVQDVS